MDGSTSSSQPAGTAGRCSGRRTPSWLFGFADSGQTSGAIGLSQLPSASAGNRASCARVVDEGSYRGSQTDPTRDVDMRLPLATLAFAVALPASVFAQDYEAPRNATVNASGATLLRIDARAGMLRVTGRADITEVRVRGTARASSRDLLEDIKLEATRNGNEVEIRVVMPEQHDSGWNWQALLDLVIEAPATLPLDIDDTSGDMTIESVAAKIRIEDTSGNIRVRDAGGDVWISDSSGGIYVSGVKGSVDIDEDSSG